ncbi:MAG: glutaminase A [Acidocella sp. 20-57-95]|nr:MAG: glutaminase A [Acidocella sp. 20-57-95]
MLDAIASDPSSTDELEILVKKVYAQYLGNLKGELADYIPELAKVAPDQFGIALGLPSGRVVSVGDANAEFTIQSISKAYTYTMLLDLIGADETLKVVGVQPSGDPFNTISLDARTNRPLNPMVNTGAIAVAGKLLELLGKEAFDKILDTFSQAAGRRLSFDQKVFESERDTGHRNRAIGHLLRAAHVYEAPVDDVLDIYFKQCSILVTAADLAVMGATTANLGVNPRTKQRVFGLDPVRQALSVMFTCGMYDGAGDWACKVGLPAKSGVGGGILAVVNRQIGIGVFSPRLDASGNSVRGQLSCAKLAEDLGLHAFDALNHGSSFLRGLL